MKIETIKKYVNEILGTDLDSPQVLNLIEQTLTDEGDSLDWSTDSSRAKAFFDFLEARQGTVTQ